MKIAVLSGKGGTGKTFVSVNLASVLKNCTYCDCDVEEPNGALFFKPEPESSTNVYVKVPHINNDKCIGCRACVNFCKFNAMLFIREKPMIFGEICHSCGGCKLVCKAQAISEKEKQVGKIEKGKSGAISVLSGILNIGEPSAVPIISKELSMVKDEKNVIIDCPPGSSCSVMESIKDADYCILVTEPTSFAFNNFKMVYELTNILKKPCGVVINKSECEYLQLEDFCKEHNLPILLRIPFEKSIANELSKGNIISNINGEYHNMFDNLLKSIGGNL